jgi:phosphatidylcholine synthase
MTSQATDLRPPSPAAGWAVHAFTASGVVMGLLALVAAMEGRAVDCLLWLGGQLLLDGVDGALARAARVSEGVPRFDGDIMDLVIDYFTYVIVPLILIMAPGVLPAGWEVPAGAAVLLSACYHYGRRDAKTADYYFNGFPAWWNIVAAYVVVLRPPPAVTLALVVALVVLTAAPVQFIHPFRVKRMRTLTLAVTAVWGAATVWMVVRHPAIDRVAVALSLAGAVYLVAVGLARTIRGPDTASVPAS